MRGDIRQKITLEGGEEVKRQLAQMGKAGEDAIRGIDRAVNAASADIGRFSAVVAATRAHMTAMSASFATAGARLGEFHGAVRTFGTAMGASAAAILPFNTNMLAMVAALTAAVAPLALFAQAKKAALATDSLVDTAENLKITTEELVALRQVSEASGASFDVLEQAMQKGNRTLGEAAAKTKGFQTAVEGGTTALRGNAAALSSDVEILRGGQQALVDVANEYAVIARLAGTTIQSLAKMSPVERLLAEGKAIGMVKDETEQARLANAAWGKTYRDMLPVLRDSTTLLKPTIARVKEFKQGVSDAEKAQSEGFLQALARTNTAMGRMFTTLGGTLGTTMVPIFKEFERVIVANQATIQAWATSIASKVMPVVEDFVALVNGGGKAELKTDFVKGLVSAFEQAKDGATIAFDVIKAGFLMFAKVLEPVAAGLNLIFGTAMTGKALAIGAAVLYVVGGFTVLAAGIAVVKAALLLAFGAPMVALIAAIAVGISMIDVEALKSGKTLETLKGTLQGLVDIGAGLSGVIGRWFTTNIIEPAAQALAAINRLIDRTLYLATLGLAGKPGANDAATAPIPPMPVAGAEQFDAHVQSLRDATAANTVTLQNAVTAQTGVLQEGVAAQTGSLKTTVEKGVNVVRGGVADMATGISETVEKGVNVIRGWGTTKAINEHIRAFTAALEEENKLIRQSIALINGSLVAMNDAVRAGTAAVINGQGVGGGGSNILPMAGGGHIRGPGTSTSDSILARLSDGEYVNKTRAVDFWGVDFFEKLNRLQNPFKGFALGGLVEGLSSSLMPRSRGFRSGGLVAANAKGGTPVYLQIHGGKAVGPMIADRDVLGALHREAKRARIFSAGPAPSSVG